MVCTCESKKSVGTDCFAVRLTNGLARAIFIAASGMKDEDSAEEIEFAKRSQIYYSHLRSSHWPTVDRQTFTRLHYYSYISTLN